LGPVGYDEEYGYGKLDAAQAVALTPHHLWLRTANQDRLGLIFLLDNQVKHMCQTVWNLGTGPQTWMLSSDSTWLTVEDASEPASAPVPSDIQVCADAGSFAGPGIFETALVASSTLSRHSEEVSVDIISVYQPQLSRVWLGLVQRREDSDNSVCDLTIR
ncbi:MAG: hypothetical protein ACE5LU_08415, partial [Anaerolineae bacterium]